MKKEVTNTFRVGCFICEMTFADGHLSAQWSPDVPRRGSLSGGETAQYRAGRDALMAEVAKVIGGNVLVLE
jgi:hypothetical protein